MNDCDLGEVSLFSETIGATWCPSGSSPGGANIAVSDDRISWQKLISILGQVIGTVFNASAVMGDVRMSRHSAGANASYAGGSGVGAAYVTAGAAHGGAKRGALAFAGGNGKAGSLVKLVGEVGGVATSWSMGVSSSSFTNPTHCLFVSFFRRFLSPLAQRWQ
jgi:hypothetical protein